MFISCFCCHQVVKTRSSCCNLTLLSIQLTCFPGCPHLQVIFKFLLKFPEDLTSTHLPSPSPSTPHVPVDSPVLFLLSSPGRFPPAAPAVGVAQSIPCIKQEMIQKTKVIKVILSQTSWLREEGGTQNWAAFGSEISPH